MMRASHAAVIALIGVVLLSPTGAGQHTHDAVSWGSPMMTRGGSWNRTFADVGTFVYHCHPHPWMEGTVRVVAPADPHATANIRIVASKFVPADDEIAVGGLVTWTNDDALGHTVTQGAGIMTHNHTSGFTILFAILSGVIALSFGRRVANR